MGDGVLGEGMVRWSGDWMGERKVEGNGGGEKKIKCLSNAGRVLQLVYYNSTFDIPTVLID